MRDRAGAYSVEVCTCSAIAYRKCEMKRNGGIGLQTAALWSRMSHVEAKQEADEETDEETYQDVHLPGICTTVIFSMTRSLSSATARSSLSEWNGTYGSRIDYDDLHYDLRRLRRGLRPGRRQGIHQLNNFPRHRLHLREQWQGSIFVRRPHPWQQV